MLGHPNYLAGFLVMALPLLVSAWRQGPARLAGPTLVPTVLAVLAVLAALSRAAWLAAGVLVVAGLFVAFRGRLRWVVAGGVVLVLLGTAGLAWADLLGPLGQRIRHLGDADTRLALWRISWDIFRDQPLTGCGLDTFQLAFARHRTLDYWQLEWGMTPSRAHNDLLHILATQGLLGGVALLGQLAAVAVAGRRAWSTRPQERPLILGLLGAVVAYHIQNLFGFPVVATSSLLVVALGCLSRLGEAEQEGRARLLPSRGQEGSAGASPSLVLVVGAILACLVLPANLLAEPGSMTRLWPAALLAGLVGLVVWAIWRGAGYIPSPSPSAPLLRSEGEGSKWLRAALTWPVVLGLAWVVVARPLVAWCLVRRGQTNQASNPEQAIAEQQRATTFAPWLDVPYAHLASTCQRVALAQGTSPLLRQAVDAAETARQRVPANPLYHANLGRMLADLARAGEGSRTAPWPVYDQALTLDPRNVIILADAAAAAVTLAEYEQAHRYLDRGRALAPGYARLLAEEGILALAEGRLVDAARQLSAALQADWKGEGEAFGRAEGLLALTCLHLNQSETALWLADDVLTRHPGRSPFEVATRWVRAAALERLGQFGEARQEAGRVLALRPDHAAGRALLERLSRR
jgi:O-antigen ligase